jgi:predicted metal-dependent HD superfamily phosphohydrolase
MDLERWWPDLLADQPQIRERLVSAYDDPARGYHDLRHLREVLEHLDDLVPADHPDRDAVVLAAWFHDAVYDAVGDNEERSARLADAVLTQAGVPIPLVEEVTRLVRLTAGHDPAADDLPGQLLCDADLAILAAGRERYDAYVAGVRQEYAEVPDADFRAGRKAVLEDLLAHDTLFHSEAARERWEERARANVSAEVAALS